MKELNQYLIEALINKNSKIQEIIDVDNLIDNENYLYNDEDMNLSEYGNRLAWDECNDCLEYFTDTYKYFLTTEFISLMKIKNNYNKSIFGIHDDLLEIKNKIITGKDLGYSIKLFHGHIEIDCINSGSRATYYIYALSEEAYDKMNLWENEPDKLEGNTDKEKLSFLYKKGNIIHIDY